MKRKRDGVVRPSCGESYGRSQGGMLGDAGGRVNRRLTMSEALSYVKEVKDAFREQPEKYHMFLKIMKDFKTQRIDRARVIARARELFEGHNRLIRGFNVFLPEGCKIALDEPPVEERASFVEAIGFIHKIKDCYQSEEHVYTSFLNILLTYRRGKEISTVYDEVAGTFAGRPDLVEGFRRLVPETLSVRRGSAVPPPWPCPDCKW